MRTVASTRTTPSANARDEVLEHAFARHDPAAYETAYRLNGSRLYATAWHIVRNDALAQECVHDVFLRLWREGKGYNPQRGSLAAFLVVCVRNEALTRLRNDARRDQLWARMRHDETYEVDEDPIERERIARAMKQLTPAQARSVDLAYFKGFTFSEVAAELGEPLGTVKSRIASALRILRRELAEEPSHA